MFMTEPASAASTVIVIVAVFASGAKLTVHATVPFSPSGGVVGQAPLVRPTLTKRTWAGSVSVTV